MKPTCPQCGHRHRNEVSQPEERLWYCHRCRMMFDDTPDEGGDFFTDPTKRIERIESGGQKAGKELK